VWGVLQYVAASFPATIQTLKLDRAITKMFTIKAAFAVYFAPFALWFSELSGLQREYSDESWQQLKRKRS